MPKNSQDRLLRPLSPINSLDSADQHFSIYQNYLTDAFEQPQMKNIALSGNFGAGKSSILHSYDRQVNAGKEKFLYISMADFELMGAKPEKEQENPGTEQEDKPEKSADDNKDGSKKPEKKKEDPRLQTQKRVEYSLLCQILARCRRQNLRHSGLKGVPEAPVGWLATLGLGLLAGVAFVLIFHEQFAVFASNLGVLPPARVMIHGWLYVAAFLGIMILAASTVRRLRLQKLTLSSPYADAEMAMSQEGTSLDLYRFELVYALSRIGRKIGYTVVFEDMDRIDPEVCVAVMTKLRDLNTMVNTRQGVIHPRSNRHFRFVYAVGEDIFNHTQRTKFYDCIIPVIPAMNRFNAEQMVCDRLRSFGVDLDNDTLWTNITPVLPYLNDYRTVITFCNEFRITRSLFMENGEANDPMNDLTMLWLAFYKVMAPRSYARMFKEHWDGRLPRITAEDLQEEYTDEAYRANLAKVLNHLSQSVSDRTLQVQYVSRQILRKQYLRILTGGAKPRRSALAAYLSADATLDMSDLLMEKRLFEKEADPRIAFDLAAHIKLHQTSEAYNDWFYRPGEPGEYKFTNCMFCLAGDLDMLHSTVKLPEVDPKKLFDWCIENLPLLPRQPHREDPWASRMTDLLTKVLDARPDQIPEAVRSIRLNETTLVSDLLPKPPAAPPAVDQQQENEKRMLAVMERFEQNVPGSVTPEEFEQWCLRILTGENDLLRFDLSDCLLTMHFLPSLAELLLGGKIIENEPQAVIAGNLIRYLFDHTDRRVFDQWFLSGPEARKFTNCMSFISINFEGWLMRLDFTDAELYRWALEGLNSLKESTEHFDQWDADMCTALGGILLRGYGGRIPWEQIPIRLTYNVTVGTVLGLDPADEERSQEHEPAI